MRTALGAGRGRLLRQFMTEGVMLSVSAAARTRARARRRAGADSRVSRPACRARAEVNVDPLVLLFTLAVSIATGVLFGLRAVLHTRLQVSRPRSRKVAPGVRPGARHHVRRGLVVAEVALAVMLVIGAGLLLRTVEQSHEGGRRLRSFAPGDVLDVAAGRPTTLSRPRARRCISVSSRGCGRSPACRPRRRCPACRRTGPLNANDTEIDNYTAPPEGPFENVDYYQNVMADYFKTMGIPIVAGRGFQRADAASTGMVAVVNETLVNTFWKDQNPIGQRLRPCCGDRFPGSRSVGVAKDVKQGGVDQKTGTEFYFFVDQTARRRRRSATPRGR